ncbi:SPPL3 [Mytilus edulis]|uniref:SPPL3 n=1 Tax=Mytilus edulis TaxID=6550 RepID=A0A8S3PXK6_MYTED|nr:SPPL3 [Mytilus edulis]
MEKENVEREREKDKDSFIGNTSAENESNMQTIDTCQAAFLPIGASVSLLIMFFFFDSLQMVFAICTAGDAPKLSLPGKLVFPSMQNSSHFSMLGLGDIVMPGLLLCFVLRYDAYKKSQMISVETGVPHPLLMYSGLHTSIVHLWDIFRFINSDHEVFKAAQPALYTCSIIDKSYYFRVLLNGNLNHIIDFVSSQLSDILLILDRYKDFINLNAKIREYCKCFLDKSKCQDKNIEPKKDCDPAPSACYFDLPITNDINCSDNEKDENSICPTCLLLCETDSKDVECDSCSFWVHYECENITQTRPEETCTDERKSNTEKPKTANESKCTYSNQETSCNTTNVSTSAYYPTASKLNISSEPLPKPAHSTQYTTKNFPKDNTNPTCASTSISIPTKPTSASNDANVQSNQSNSTKLTCESHDLKGHNKKPITILSFNIEGFTSNKLYLENLSKRADIIFMQEHWVHSWEKNKIEDFMDNLNFISHIKCYDDEIIMDPLERKRGHAGVAICYKKDIANCVEKLNDGGNRVIAIRINSAKPVISICVYLPTRGNKITRDDYIAVLDELVEIILKYRQSSDILIGGDVNASLHRSSINRRHEANKRQNKMSEIMTLSETNDKQFYTLVKHQRRQGSPSTSVLKYNDNVADCDEDILETWADYFEDLAISVNNPCFDNDYKTRVENDNCLLHEMYSTNRDPLPMVVRQGGVWSPAAYTIFINSLLKIYETEQIGARIGSVYCGVPTVADDVTLVSNDPFELQSMLDIQMFHANKQRYIISSQKSCVLQRKSNETHSWNINGQTLKTPDTATHLEIKRDNGSNTGTKEVVPDRVQTARKTVYALMGAGLHGLMV